MQCSDSGFKHVSLYYYRNTNGACRDHLDVDVVVGKHPKHLCGNTRARLHARANERQLDNVLVLRNTLRANLIANLFQDWKQYPQAAR